MEILGIPIVISDRLPADQIMLAARCPACGGAKEADAFPARELRWVCGGDGGRRTEDGNGNGTTPTNLPRACSKCGGHGAVAVLITDIEIVEVRR